MCIVIICFLVCDINFGINNLSFLIKTFFYITKSQDKNTNILRTKRSFNMKEKVFFIIFKGLSLKHINEKNEWYPSFLKIWYSCRGWKEIDKNRFLSVWTLRFWWLIKLVYLLNQFIFMSNSNVSADRRKRFLKPLEKGQCVGC